MKIIRIGNGCGFWGDNLDAPIRLAETGQLDYLTLEYLAELTMSILALQKQRDPNHGYARDFIDVLSRLVPILRQQPPLKIITNAGGMNALACGQAAKSILEQAGLTERKVAIVSGDDLLPELDTLLASGHTLAHLDTGEPLASIRPRVVSANVYLGAEPIAEALRQSASIVITGRVADAALTLGPAMQAFGWSLTDTDLVAAGIVAGHLIECGAQVTGGLWCNADASTRFAEVGYPIAEVAADGTLRITKPAGTGGAVNRETVTEQLLYEVGDPARYLTPDGIADFTSVQLSELSPDVVEITGSRGLPAPETLKVSIAYRDGFMASGTLVIAGPGSVAKARLCGQIILDRLQQAGYTFADSHIECIGAGDSVPGVLPVPEDPPEVLLRVAVRHERREAVERFTKEFAPLVTSGPPGVSGYTTGRPSVREVFAFWPALLDRSLVTPRVEML